MKNKKLFIPVVLGTGRKGRHSLKVAKYVIENVKKYGYETELIDVANFAKLVTIPSWIKSSKTSKWKKIMDRADGLIVVCPEYNHGYPGELKIFLDSAFAEYNRKPAAICGVSNGGFGGSRVVEMLRIMFATLGLVTVRSSIYFSNVETLFTKGGEIRDKSYTKRVKDMLDDFNFYALALKEAREKNK